MLGFLPMFELVQSCVSELYVMPLNYMSDNNHSIVIACDEKLPLICSS